MKVVLLNSRCLIGFAILLTVASIGNGCKSNDLLSPTPDSKPKVTVSIGGSMTANSELLFTATVSPLPKGPYICIWSFGDTSNKQYSQDEKGIVHYYNKPGSYLVHVLVLGAYSADTIAFAEGQAHIDKQRTDDIISIFQTMKLVTVLFVCDKIYEYTGLKDMLKNEKQNYFVSSPISICGRFGGYDNSNYDYSSNSVSSSSTYVQHIYVSLRSGLFLDSLSIGNSGEAGSVNSAGQYIFETYSEVLTVFGLPLKSITNDSIVFEASGEAVKNYCRMVDTYWAEESYQLRSIEWGSVITKPLLRVVLKK
jgi:hypothetical protein